MDKDEDEELGDEVAAITSEGDEFGGAIVIDAFFFQFVKFG